MDPEALGAVCCSLELDASVIEEGLSVVAPEASAKDVKGSGEDALVGTSLAEASLEDPQALMTF